jgi:hypothetical protein
MSEIVALIGADPEVFVQSLVTDGRGRAVRWEPTPAFGLFGGNKDKPNPMQGLDEGYMFLEDNAALEFNIPPQATARGFSEAISRSKTWMQQNLLEQKKLQYIDQNVLELAPKFQKDPRGKEVGCMADFDSYDNEGAQRKPFSADSLGNTRYAGGHIHLAYNVDIVPAFVAARFLDLYLSLPWIEYDKQGPRRTTYGKAGLFRAKSYGVEYRTMSNWWVWMPERIQEQIATTALKFARFTYDEGYLRNMSDAYVGLPWDDIKRCVESEDYRSANMLIDLADKRYNLGIRARRR